MPDENKERTINLDDDFEFEIKPTKSAIAAVAAGILIILAGFLAYNIFSKPKATPTITPEAISEENTGQEQGALDESVQSAESQQSALAGENTQALENDSQVGTTIPDTSVEATVLDQSGQAAEVTTPAVGGSDTGTWVALAHAANSISGNTYTVQSGDTLWEIAQGRYGSGFEWSKIAQANGVQNSPQGYPLIFPGQVLTLP